MLRPVMRSVANIASAEDRLQDAICQTWETYRRNALDEDVIMDDALPGVPP